MTDYTPLETIERLTPVARQGEGLVATAAPAMATTLERYLAHYRLDVLLTEGVTLHAGNIETPRFRLWTQVWRPPRPRGTAVVVHGYYDHLGLYRHLLELLLEIELTVVLWDLPGHGLSSGDRADIDDFADYGDCLRTLQQHLSEAGLAQGPWVGVGQSTGGAILATDALSRGDDGHWSALVLLAPLVRPWGWTRAAWVHRLVSPFVSSVPRKFRANTNDDDFATFLREQDPLQPVRLPTGWVSAMRRWMPRLMQLPPCQLPTLILQGEKDLTVDGPWNLAVLGKKFPGAHICCHPQARHHLVNEAEAIRLDLFAEVRQFLEQQLSEGPLPKRMSSQCPDA